MNKTNHLEYYKECLETGLLKGQNICGIYHSTNGLCNEPYIDQELLELFRPDKEDIKTFKLRDDDIGPHGWWGVDDLPDNEKTEILEAIFSPLRQTIVLFIAAMKDQL